MIEITPQAEDALYTMVARYVGRRKYYGPPPIFYWQQKVISETYSLECFDYLSNGFYKYNMEHHLGVIRFTVSHITDKGEPVFIITGYEFNTRAVPHWQRQPMGKPGLLESYKRFALDNKTLIKKMLEYDFN